MEIDGNKNKITWSQSEFRGITFCQHETRKHGVNYDKYFRGQYQVNGKRRTIGFGWLSEGWTAKKAFLKLNEFKKNAKEGKKPTTLKEEQDMAAERAAEEQAEKKRLERENITFSSFFLGTYSPQARNDKKESSYRKEESLHKTWIKPVFGDKPLKQVSVSDLEELKNKMQKADCAPRTIQYCLAVVRQVFNRAIALDLYVDRNPVKKVKIPTVDNQRTRFLTQKEADHLLQKLKEQSQDLHDTALLSLHTGMRAGEIFNLRWRDIDFKQGIIHVKDTKDARRGSKARYVYMSSTVSEMLSEKRQKSSSDFVFPARNGGKRKTIPKQFYAVVEKSGLNDGVTDDRDKVCFHTLRHSFASWQVQAGMSLYEIQRLLGHESFSMVQRYAHLAPENLKKATAIFDKKDGKVVNFPKSA